MRIAHLIAALDALAPFRFAAGWDNVGLLLGDASAESPADVLLTIDLTDDVTAEAIERRVGAVVAYHPPLFKPVTRLTDASREGRTLLQLAAAGIAVVSPHTALDAARGGVNDWLLERVCGEHEKPGTRRALEPTFETDPTQFYKLITFVPENAVDAVSEALAAAGAGVIGEYTRCSYRLRGEGTFLPGDAANPAIGERGEFETVAEVRYETVVPGRSLAAAVAALYASHPYEEPAFDVVKREPTGDGTVGMGRICELTTPVRVERLAERAKRELGVERVRLAIGGDSSDERDVMIERVAACPGAGASLFREAGLLAGSAEGLLLVTGEMSHHEVLAAKAAGACVLLAGHTRTERGYLPVLAERLKPALAEAGSPDVGVHVSERDAWPLREV